jgi:Na+/alanine symporter
MKKFFWLLGFLGFIGFLGFFKSYMYFAFFAFFSNFFTSRYINVLQDKQLQNKMAEAHSISFVVTSFFLSFMLIMLIFNVSYEIFKATFCIVFALIFIIDSYLLYRYYEKLIKNKT